MATQLAKCKVHVNLPIQVQPGWEPVGYLDQNLALPSRLHFTLSVLSLCLITRQSMLTVTLLGEGLEGDWEIKFILNSFPLMW